MSEWIGLPAAVAEKASAPKRAKEPEPERVPDAEPSVSPPDGESTDE
ncbi:hypothetical protein [Kribbella capetownensis]|nr:hypothetical protein [Kribbella capetownensis]